VGAPSAAAWALQRHTSEGQQRPPSFSLFTGALCYFPQRTEQSLLHWSAVHQHEGPGRRTPVRALGFSLHAGSHSS